MTQRKKGRQGLYRETIAVKTPCKGLRSKGCFVRGSETNLCNMCKNNEGKAFEFAKTLTALFTRVNDKEREKEGTLLFVYESKVISGIFAMRRAVVVMSACSYHSLLIRHILKVMMAYSAKEQAKDVGSF